MYSCIDVGQTRAGSSCLCYPDDELRRTWFFLRATTHVYAVARSLTPLWSATMNATKTDPVLLLLQDTFHADGEVDCATAHLLIGVLSPSES